MAIIQTLKQVFSFIEKIIKFYIKDKCGRN